MEKQHTASRLVFAIDPKVTTTGMVGFLVEQVQSKDTCYYIDIYKKEVKPYKYKGKVSLGIHYERIHWIEKNIRKLRKFIKKTADSYSIDQADIVIEGHSYGARGRSLLGGVEAAWSIKRLLDPYYFSRVRVVCLIPPTCWKSIALGNGRIKPDQVGNILYHLYDFNNSKEDINHAFGIGMAYIKMLCSSPRSMGLLKNYDINFYGSTQKDLGIMRLKWLKNIKTGNRVRMEI